MLSWLILPLGPVLSRWHGGGFFKSPKVLKNILWCVPPVVLSWIAAGPLGLISFLNILKSTGHGRGFRLKEPMKDGSKPEIVEKVIPDFLPLYWYKVSIMALTGLLGVIGSVIVFSYINPLAGLIVALGGLSKGLNAMIFDKNTEAREYADGFTAYLGIIIAYNV